MVASDRQVMYWAPDKKTAVALKCLSTHSAVVQSFTSDTARKAVAVLPLTDFQSRYALRVTRIPAQQPRETVPPGLILQSRIDKTYY